MRQDAFEENGMGEPIATVVVPTRGERLDWLQSCLASVTSQKPRVHCLVVGPEMPELRELCSRFGAELLVESGKGMAEAVNQGIGAASTPFVTWIGDDDLLARGAIEVTVAALESSPRASMVYGQCRIIDGTGERQWTIRPGRIAIPVMRYSTQLVPQPGSLIRLRALEDVGFLDPTLRNPMDLDLFLRLRTWGHLVYVPRVVAAFRVHPTSLTVTNPDPGREAREVRLRYLNGQQKRAMNALEPALTRFSKLLAALQIHDPRPDRAIFDA